MKISFKKSGRGWEVYQCDSKGKQPLTGESVVIWANGDVRKLAATVGWNQNAHMGRPCGCAMCEAAATTMLEVMQGSCFDDPGYFSRK